jgi:iron complex transport system substrate-binding protein
MGSGNRKMIAVVLVAVLLVAALAVVLMNNKGSSGTNTATVTDASGTNVTLSKAPERVISGAPDITEIVNALGLTDKLVAVTDYDDYPAEVKALRDNNQTIGGFYTPSFEKVVSYNPDLVILTDSVSAQKDLTVQLRGAGYTVVLINAATNLTQVYENIDMLGKITGKQSVATELVAEMKARISVISTRVNSAGVQPNVMFVTYAEAGFTNVWPAGGSTAIDQIITLAGGKNAFSEMDGFVMASDEVLKSKAASVDVIVMTIMYSIETPENTSAWFKSDALWKESPAAKNNKIYFLTGQSENIFNRESVRTVNAVQLMAEILHPDSFSTKVPYSVNGTNIIGDEYEQYLTSGTGSQVSSVAVAATSSRD